MKCRGCGSKELELILDLGEHPWCNDFLKEEEVGREETFPLRLKCCEGCNLLQLDHTVPKEKMFADHCYLSGVTSTLRNHFYEVASENVEQFDMKSDDLVVDIGGNDGSQLLQYKECGIENVLNVESSSRVSDYSKMSGVRTINEFFNRECVDQHLGNNSVKLYNASGVFFHLEELHSVIDGIKVSLRDDGVLIVQFMYAGTMIEKMNFDTIYHEHLCYYTLASLKSLLQRYDLEIFDAYYSEIHSGSIIAKVTHRGGSYDVKTDRYLELHENDKKYTTDSFKEFAQKVESKKGDLKDFLQKLKASGKTIYAYGAPAKGNTLLNYFGIDNSLIDMSVEINELKIGHYLPGSHIPIVDEKTVEHPDYYLLLSHNFEKEIIEKNKDLIDRGVKFIIPFPTLRVIE